MKCKCHGIEHYCLDCPYCDFWAEHDSPDPFGEYE